jgi:hypothetical protein
MKAAKVWCVAGLVLVAGLATVSCGKDEGGNDGDGMILGGEGGSTAGSSGNPGRAGGGSTNGGSGGSSGVITSSALGMFCSSDADCNDPAAPGLTCVTNADDLGNGAPPNGLCTAACTVETDDCEAKFGTGAVCFPFNANNSDGYCVEGCITGSDPPGKCHDRPDFACTPVALGDTMEPCTSSAQCEDGEGCFDGTCNFALTACMPACRGDLDCGEGKYCDLSFLAGTCVDEKPVGKTIGQPCSMVGGEPDDCLGFCQADEAGGTTGHCVSTCAIGAGCSWDAESEKFGGFCLFPSVFSPDSRAHLLDWGFCDPVCNCEAECNDPALGCYPSGALMLTTEDYAATGLCFALDTGEGGAGGATPQMDQCTAAGGNGAGGNGAGGDTSVGGAGGAGGSP